VFFFLPDRQFDYATQIGLRYLVIPAMVIAAGIVADEAVIRKPRKIA